MVVAWKAGGKFLSRVQHKMTEQTVDDFPCDAHTLNCITILIAKLADEFQVPYRSAALRAVGLGIVSQQQWDGIQSMARQEAMVKILKA